MILLSAQNIAKTYMERKVLDDVSFFLNEGDKVGIIGINGTGKSTLLRILAGAEEPDSGNVIRTNGIRISYLPQIPEFEPHGSVLEQRRLRQSRFWENWALQTKPEILVHCPAAKSGVPALLLL